MIQYWLSICGLLIGYQIGGTVGAMLGLFFGYRLVPSREQPSNFLEATFATLGHLSKAKGRVTHRDIQFATSVMNRLQLDQAARTAAQQAFQRGKRVDFQLRALLRAFLIAQDEDRALILFMEIQLRAVFAAGTPQASEWAVLRTIMDELDVSPQQLQQLLALLEATGDFEGVTFDPHHFFEERYTQQRADDTQRRHYHSHRQNNHPTSVQQLTLADACRVLGVDSNDEVATIKRAYRKLIVQHHPDKLASRGLSPARLEQEKRQSQEIQAAYNVIKQIRNFK